MNGEYPARETVIEGLQNGDRGPYSDADKVEEYPDGDGLDDVEFWHYTNEGTVILRYSPAGIAWEYKGGAPASREDPPETVESVFDLEVNP